MKLLDILISQDFRKRAAAVYAVSLATFFVSWQLSYALLPEYIFRGVLPSSGIGLSSSSVLISFLEIGFTNLGVATILALTNKIRVRGFPLGYIPLFFNWAGFGAFLGTNSFAVSQEKPMPINIYHLITSSGLYELTGLTLIVASTISLWRFSQEKWFGGKVIREQKKHLKLIEIAGTLIGLSLIVGASYWEALKIISLT